MSLRIVCFFRGLLLTLVVYVLLACAGWQEVLADDVCALSPTQEILETKSATASAWDNFRKNPGSLNFESARMIAAAEAGLKDGQAIYFSSVPGKFLSSYPDKPQCERLAEQTTRSPLVFSGLSFQSLSDFDSWFGDFSQGRGREGEKLYRLCPGSCSPQYFCYIYKKPSGKFEVRAEVICVVVRDKSDNIYVLKSGYIPECAVVDQ